jgi:hypothetical protein
MVAANSKPKTNPRRVIARANAHARRAAVSLGRLKLLLVLFISRPA